MTDSALSARSDLPSSTISAQSGSAASAAIERQIAERLARPLGADAARRSCACRASRIPTGPRSSRRSARSGSGREDLGRGRAPAAPTSARCSTPFRNGEGRCQSPATSEEESTPRDQEGSGFADARSEPPQRRAAAARGCGARRAGSRRPTRPGSHPPPAGRWRSSARRTRRSAKNSGRCWTSRPPSSSCWATSERMPGSAPSAPTRARSSSRSSRAEQPAREAVEPGEGRRQDVLDAARLAGGRHRRGERVGERLLVALGRGEPAW